MEKFVKKDATERFAPLGVNLAVVGGGMFAAIKFGNMAEKAQEEGKIRKASILRTASSICGWASGLTAVFVLPCAVGEALNGKKPSPEYNRERGVIEAELIKEINIAEADYQTKVDAAVDKANMRLAEL